MDKKLRSEILHFIDKEFVLPLEGKIKKAGHLKEYDPHPFTLIAMASSVFGGINARTLAMSLIYPRVLGTSINTTFGNKIQAMCTHYLGAEGSGISGMDLQFIDKTTGDKIIAQLKAGPNTINSPDVEPIIEKFRAANRLLRTNSASSNRLFAICVAYGTESQLSANYQNIHSAEIGSQSNVPIFIGKDFWHRLTGDQGFYDELMGLFMEAFEQKNYAVQFDAAIDGLAAEVGSNYFTKGIFDPKKI